MAVGTDGRPRGVAYKSMNVGKIFAMQFSLDVPYLLGCGGDKGMVAIWESDELETVRHYFESRSDTSYAAPVSLAIGGMNLGGDRGGDSAIAASSDAGAATRGEEENNNKSSKNKNNKKKKNSKN